uniref:RWD domain-containing protein n=1 Tax=Syphacia muris TaxID=451379 RepID=A0A0N5AQ01_9BILA
MTSLEEQETEREVLKSIFEGDDRFKEIEKNKFQYFFGEKGHYKSFVLEIIWTETYPQTEPTINLDLFYNTNLFNNVKQRIAEELNNEAKNYLGMAVTFTLIEYVKENFDRLLEDQTELKQQRIAEIEDVDSKAQNNLTKKVQMTKAQKKRMWDRTTAATLNEQERGWNWVDVIHHLSQTRDNL